MSKEPTALEELIDNEITDLYHEGKYDYDTYLRLHDWLSEIVKEEEEQREELIKKTYVNALINLTILEEGKISKEQMEMIYKRAEQYYNGKCKISF